MCPSLKWSSQLLAAPHAIHGMRVRVAVPVHARDPRRPHALPPCVHCSQRPQEFTAFLLLRGLSPSSIDCAPDVRPIGPCRMYTPLLPGPMSRSSDIYQSMTGPMSRSSDTYQSMTGPMSRSSDIYQSVAGPMSRSSDTYQSVAGPMSRSSDIYQSVRGPWL